jgi:hypothetical protein
VLPRPSKSTPNSPGAAASAPALAPASAPALAPVESGRVASEEVVASSSFLTLAVEPSSSLLASITAALTSAPKSPEEGLRPLEEGGGGLLGITAPASPPSPAAGTTTSGPTSLLRLSKRVDLDDPRLGGGGRLNFVTAEGGSDVLTLLSRGVGAAASTSSVGGPPDTVATSIFCASSRDTSSVGEGACLIKGLTSSSPLLLL